MSIVVQELSNLAQPNSDARLEWNGVERNGKEGRGKKWNGMEWNGVEWNEVEGNVLSIHSVWLIVM